MERKYQAINWHQLPDRVDYSAWSRLNDFIWEPERVPLHQDKPTFAKLGVKTQTALLHAFASLSFLSTIQVRLGNDAVKQDAATPQEISVFTALTYLEAIANKGYSNVLQVLAPEQEIDVLFDWANKQPHLEQLADILDHIYKTGRPLQKKIALSFTEMCLYHLCFYAPLYLFGQKKLTRTAELVQMAIRSTTFNAMYPAVKFRAEWVKKKKTEQRQLKQWLNTFIKQIVPISEKLLAVLYSQVGWLTDAKHYFRYTINKNYLNLGFHILYPDSTDTLNQIIQRGIIKSAVFEDFFYYANQHRLTKIHYRK